MQATDKVVFLGSKPLGLKCLRALRETLPELALTVQTIDDRTDRRSAFGGIQDFCADERLAISIVSHQRESEARVAQGQPALCLVVGWYWVISRAALKVPAKGYLGIHFSLLPKYRGMSPLVWALINGEPKIGTSLFSFVEEMDAGPVWSQRSVEVCQPAYVGEVLPRLEDVSVDMLKEVLPGILGGRLEPSEQNHAERTYCAARQPADARIDWRWPAPRVVRFIRAQSDPYPGAFTTIAGNRMIVWRASEFAHSYLGSPGQVVPLPGNRKGVVCGDGHAIELEQFEYPGTRGTSHSAPTLRAGMRCDVDNKEEGLA